MIALKHTTLLCSLLIVSVSAFPQNAHWLNDRSIEHRYTLSYLPQESERPLPVIQFGYVSRENAPMSKWVTRQNAQNARKLEPTDWLVLPFQLQARGFTKPLRTLMSASFSEYLTTSAGINLNDPFTLSAALGHPREIAWQDAIALADKLNAQHIVAPFIGHLDDGDRITDPENTKLTLVVVVLAAERQPDGSWSTPTPSHDLYLPFDHDSPPDQVLKKLFPEIGKWLGLQTKPVKALQAVAAHQPLAYPQQEFESALDRALYLQALATMTPDVAEVYRRNLFVQSIHVLASAKPSPAVQLLRARGYHNIGLTAYAQTLAADSDDKALQCYRAYLRVNFDALLTCSNKITNALQKVMQLLDIARFAARQDVDPAPYQQQIVAALANVDATWWPVVQAKLDTLDPWKIAPVDWVKTQLDTHFPVAGFDLGSLKVNDSFALGQTPIHLTPIVHIRRYQSQYDVTDPTLLGFLQAHAEAHLVRTVQRTSFNQTLPQQGLEYLEELWEELDGHPGLTARSASAHLQLAQKAQGPARQHHLSTAFEQAARAYYWSQDTDDTATYAFNLMRQTRVHLPTSLWGMDFPTLAHLNHMDPLSWALYSPQDFRLYKSAVSDFIRRDIPLLQLGDRFKGFPKQAAVLAAAYRQLGDHKKARQHYQQATVDEPNTFSSYEVLAEYEFNQGNLDTAYDILAAFPPFQQQIPGEAVRYSKRAYEAGSLFFWKGQPHMARTFFKAASDYGSGSSGHIGAQQRLAQIDNNLPVAAELARYRIQRYDNQHAVRDFVGLLSALGYAQPGLEVFDARSVRFDDMAAWTGALVAQRALGWSNDDIEAWIKRPDFNAETTVPVRSHYLSRHFLTDRTPLPSAHQALLAYAFPWLRHNVPGAAEELPPDFRRHYLPFSTTVGDHVTMTPDPQNRRFGINEQAGTIVMPPVISFVDAYRHVRDGNFTAAGKVVATHRKDHPLTAAYLDYTLPLFTYVLTKLGQHEDVHAQLNAAKNKLFGLDLARFVLSGLNGDTDAALRHLDLAIAHMEPPASSPLDPSYQVADALLWMHTETGKPVYAQRLVDWARAFQKVAPYHAWAYAVEAVYGDGEAQAAALRKAVLLDANSDLLKSLPDEMVEKARKANEAANPFMPEVVEPQPS